MNNSEIVADIAGVMVVVVVVVVAVDILLLLLLLRFSTKNHSQSRVKKNCVQVFPFILSLAAGCLLFCDLEGMPEPLSFNVLVY